MKNLLDPFKKQMREEFGTALYIGRIEPLINKVVELVGEYVMPDEAYRSKDTLTREILENYLEGWDLARKHVLSHLQALLGTESIMNNVKVKNSTKKYSVRQIREAVRATYKAEETPDSWGVNIIYEEWFLERFWKHLRKIAKEI